MPPSLAGAADGGGGAPTLWQFRQHLTRCSGGLDAVKAEVEAAAAAVHVGFNVTFAWLLGGQMGIKDASYGHSLMACSPMEGASRCR